MNRKGLCCIWVLLCIAGCFCLKAATMSSGSIVVERSAEAAGVESSTSAEGEVSPQKPNSEYNPVQMTMTQKRYLLYFAAFLFFGTLVFSVVMACNVRYWWFGE